MEFIRRYKLQFALFWLLLFAGWYYFRADGYASTSTAFWVTFIKVVDLALMVCICNYLLIPRLLYKKKYVLFVLSLVLMVVTSSLLKMQLLGRVMNSAFLMDWSIGWKVKIYDNVLPHFFLVLTGAAIKLMIDFLNLQSRMAAIAKEKAEAELVFLKQQINPHFLFNVLNTVYFQIDKTNTQARKSLHQLSDMLRYQLYEAKEDKIPIEKEIQYLHDYISLQSQRRDEIYKVNFSVNENVKGFSIEPFLLLPFVENCFKHISHFTEQPNIIDIQLTMEDGLMVFTAKNTYEKQLQGSHPPGIGLANTRRRLELLYPGAFDLQQQAKEDLYTVILKLNIHGTAS